MTVLTDKDLKDRFGASDDEITKAVRNFQRRHRGKSPNKTQLKRIKERIRASKISMEPGKEFSFKQTIADWQVIYGKCRVPGVLTFVHSGGNNTNLNLVYTIACHEIEAVDKVFLDGEEVIFGATPDARWSTAIRRVDGTTYPADHKVFMAANLGSAGQAAQGDLMTQCPDKWTATDKQSGRAHVYLILAWDAAIFPNGAPDVTFEVRGKKVYDPRTATTVYSNNAVLCIADYLTASRTDSYGIGVPTADVDSTNWQAEANTCDEVVTPIPGTTEARYTINGYFQTSQSPRDVLEAMCASMAGFVTAEGGKIWKFYPGRYRTPTFTITEADILSDIRLTTKISRRDNFNAVKGTYVSSTTYEETDFPPLKNDFYMGQDNGERIWEDLQFPFVTSVFTAMRIGQLELERVRQPIGVEFTAKLRCVELEPGDTVSVTLARFGWVAKVFEVQSSSIDMVSTSSPDASDAPVFGVTLALRETAAGVYTYTPGAETQIDLAGNTTLPNLLSVTLPVGVALASGTNELYRRADGTIFTRVKVSWTHVEDAFIASGGEVQVQFRQTVGAGSWSNATPVPGDQDFLHVLDVQDGTFYDFRVRNVSAANVPSDWVTISNYFVIGKSERPSDVTGFAAQQLEFGIRLSWNHIPDLDRKEYIIKLGDLDDTWENSVEIKRTEANVENLESRPTGEYRFQIKAVDTSLNESLNAAIVAYDIDAPTQVIISKIITGPNITLSWTPSAGQFAIAGYKVLVGPIYATANEVATIQSTAFNARVDWGGTRRFWIVAYDVANNLGVENHIDVTIESPSAVQDSTAEVIDNNVLLRWRAPASGTLPIDHYKVFKGAVFGTAIQVGQVTATFAAIFETISGSYTYWIQPVDTAGNFGLQRGVPAQVNEPPDFVLLDDFLIDPNDGTSNNVIVQDNIVNPSIPSISFKTVVPVEIQDLLANPGMGPQTTEKSIIQLNAEAPPKNPLNIPSGDMVGRLQWCYSEPSAGVYDFSAEIDNKIRNAKLAGQTVNFRVITYDESNSFRSTWFQTFAGVTGYTYLDSADGGSADCWAPDWDNATVQTRLASFLQALADHTIDGIRFADHPNLGVIDTGVWGLYGENHHSDAILHDTTITLTSVTAGQTITIAGLVFTAHATTTTVASRQFSIAGTNTQDAAELVTCINNATFGVPGITASNSNNVVRLRRTRVTSLTVTPSAGTMVVNNNAYDIQMPEPSEASQQYIIDQIVAKFPNKLIIGLVDALITLEYAVNDKGGGFRADGYGNPWHMNNLYPSRRAAVPLYNTYLQSQNNAEPYSTITSWVNSSWNVQSILDTIRNVDHCAAFNTKNLMNPPASVTSIWVDFVRRLGYRHVITFCQFPTSGVAGQASLVSLQFDNKGCAPSFMGHFVAVRLSKTGTGSYTSLTSQEANWPPGPYAMTHDIVPPSWLPTGTYTVSVGIVDPNSRRGDVRCAIAGRDATGYYPMETINIINNSPTFSPLAYPGIACYLHGGSGAIKTQAGSIAAIANDFCEEWQDQSGQGRHVEQLTATKKPQWVASAINSLPGFLFDGSNDFFSGNRFFKQMLTDVAKLKIFVVLRCLTQNATNHIFCMNASTGVRARMLDSGTPPTMTYNVGGRRLDADSFASQTSVVTHGANVTQLRTATFDWSNRSISLHVNGSNGTPVVNVPTFFASAGNTSATDMLLAAIGAGADGTADFTNMYLCEFVAYTASSPSADFLSAADIAAIEAGLAARYGITIA